MDQADTPASRPGSAVAPPASESEAVGTTARQPVVEVNQPAVAMLETPTLTKADLSELLFDRLGLNKRESKDMVDAFFGIVHSALSEGREVKLSGFGNFNIRRKAPRPGRNPRTGEPIPIKARHVVTFHASPKLKAIVQGDAPGPEDFE
jgi:integration host factor subunit alpha